MSIRCNMLWTWHNIVEPDGRCNNIVRTIQNSSVIFIVLTFITDEGAHKKTPWHESAKCKLSAGRGCHVVSVTDPYIRNFDFLDRSRYFFFQVAPQLFSWGWVDSVPDSLLFRKSGSTGNWTRTPGSVARNSDHWITEAVHQGAYSSSK
jgi:hypothetical protein